MPDPSPERGDAAPERVDLLIDCLAESLPAQRLGELRALLLTDPVALEGMIRAADRRQLTAAAIDGLVRNGLVLPARARPGQPPSARAQLDRMREALAGRRAVLREGLADIIAALNRAGIEPLILKGSVSLLTGEPAWRFQRDIDFAIHPAEANACVTALHSIGFQDDPHPDAGPSSHHIHPLLRERLPAVVEPHVRLFGDRSRTMLPEDVLLKEAESQNFGALKVRLLRSEHFLLFGLVHHHFQNQGAIYGTVSLKGLLEYAHALGELEPPSVARLKDFLKGRPRLAGAVEFWTAACVVLLCKAAPHGLEPGPYALRRADLAKQRLVAATIASKLDAWREDVVGAASATGHGLPRWPALATAAVQAGMDGIRQRKFVSGPRTVRRVSGILSDV